MCPYNPKPHGKKSAVDNFANIWMVDCAIIIFSMVCYNTYEYLQHDVFPLEWLKKINCTMKKLNLTTMVWYKKYECLQRHVFPLEQQEDFLFKKDISVIQKYSIAL